MDKAFHAAICLAASSAAFILFFIGVRELRIKRKPGPFMLALVISLSLIGICCSSQGGRSSSSGISARDRQNINSDKRIKELNKREEWKNFKAFWKKLDEVEPKKKGDNEGGYFGNYYGAVTPGEADRWHKELKGLIAGLKLPDLKNDLDPLEVDILEKICIERIYQMSIGSPGLMVRMAMPSNVLEKEHSVRDLELKIDTLLKLKKTGKVDTKEFNDALSNIQKDIESFSAYHALGEDRAWGYNFRSRETEIRRLALGSDKVKITVGNSSAPEEDKTGIIDRLMEENEKNYVDFKARSEEERKNYYKNFETKYCETREALKKLKKIFPSFNVIIADLEK